MDEAVQEAMNGLRIEVGQVRHDISEMRDDFKLHVGEDKEVWAQVIKWSGAISLAAWVLGLGVPAILGVLIVHVAKHW